MMDSNASATYTSNIFDLLIKGRKLDKVKALEDICNGTRRLDRRLLRISILHALEGKFKYERGSQEQDDEVASTRRWLLSALSRLSADAREATEFVRKHLDPEEEPDPLARYWLFEGLIASGAPDLENLAREIKEREERKIKEEEQKIKEGEKKALLVRMLAVAFLASQGDSESREEIKEHLKIKEEGLQVSDSHLQWQWATLWALDDVPVEAAVPYLLDLVRAADNEDNRHLTVYRAILALRKLPSTFRSQTKKDAAWILADFVRRKRAWPAWDEARTKALTALGNLGDESIASTLIEELIDDNAAIAREAALALEKVAGIKVATVRIVEAACKREDHGVPVTRDSYMGALASALRWMEKHESVVEELGASMDSGPPDQQEVARKLLSEMGGLAAFQKLQAREAAVKKYTEAMKEAEKTIRELFDRSLKEARNGFRLAIGMDVLVFLLGLILLGISAVLTLKNTGSLSGWAVGVTGATGVLGVLYGTLIAKPRQGVQEAVKHLTRLNVVFLGYLRQLHQSDQAYTRHLVEDKTPMKPEDVDKFSKMVEKTMKNAVQQLDDNLLAQTPEPKAEPERSG